MSAADPCKDAQLADLKGCIEFEAELAELNGECLLNGFFDDHCDYSEDEQLAIATHICRKCQRSPCPME